LAAHKKIELMLDFFFLKERCPANADQISASDLLEESGPIKILEGGMGSCPHANSFDSLKRRRIVQAKKYPSSSSLRRCFATSTNQTVKQ